MMGTQTAPAQLFYDFDLERHVPSGHMLRESRTARCGSKEGTRTLKRLSLRFSTADKRLLEGT
jgi:hypothetical protein